MVDTLPHYGQPFASLGSDSCPHWRLTLETVLGEGIWKKMFRAGSVIKCGMQSV